MPWFLVLGAKSDIARASARRFAGQGFNIYLAGRGHKELEEDAADLAIRYKINAKSLEFDALDFKSHPGFYESITEKPLGVLCAVGHLGDQKKAEGDFEEAQKIMETNYTGCVSILNIIAADLEKRKEGFIIAISSVAGDRGRQSNYMYGSAKAGLSAYLSGLRNRLSPSNVSVLTVKPGFVATRMTRGLDLPKALLASPEQVAEDIFRAWKKGKNIVYTRWYWKFIMAVINNIPERIFKRMKL